MSPSRAASIPPGLRLRCARALIRPGLESEAERWMQMLNDRRDEAVQTLERERVAVEIVPPRALRWLPKVEHEPRWPMTDTSCQPGCPGLEERDLLSPAEAGELARLFKLLANDSRLRMLHALARAGELRVTDSRPRWT